MIPFHLFVDLDILNGCGGGFGSAGNGTDGSFSVGSSHNNLFVNNSNTNQINNYFDQQEFPVIVEEEPPMIPSPSYTLLSQIGPITPAILGLFTTFDRHQALVILDSVLNFLTTDPLSSKQSITLLWDLLYSRYLCTFFPINNGVGNGFCNGNGVSNADANFSNNNNNNPFLLFPPKPIISLLMYYMSQWILDLPPSKGPQVPLMLLKEFFLEDPASTPISLFNNVLEKVSNLTDCASSASSGGDGGGSSSNHDGKHEDDMSLLLRGHQIIRKWTLSPKDRRPSFLQKPSATTLKHLYISIMLSSFRKGAPKPVLESVICFSKDLIVCYDSDDFVSGGVSGGGANGSSDNTNTSSSGSGNTDTINKNTSSNVTIDFLIQKQHEMAKPFLLENNISEHPIMPSLINSLFFTLIKSGKKEHWKSLKSILSASPTSSVFLVGEWSSLMAAISDGIIPPQPRPQPQTRISVNFLERAYQIARPKTEKYPLSLLFPSRQSSPYTLPLTKHLNDLVTLWRNFLALLPPPVPVKDVTNTAGNANSTTNAHLLWTHCLSEMVVHFDGHPMFLLDLIDPLMLVCAVTVSTTSSPSRLLGHSALSKIFCSPGFLGCSNGVFDGGNDKELNLKTKTKTKTTTSKITTTKTQEARFILLTLYALSDRDDPDLLGVQLSALSRMFESSLISASILIPPIVRAMTTVVRGGRTSTAAAAAAALMQEIIRLCQGIYLVTSGYRGDRAVELLRIGRLEVPLQMMSSIPISLINWMDLSGSGGDSLRLQLLDIIHMLPAAPCTEIESLLISFLLMVVEVEAFFENTMNANNANVSLSPAVHKILEILLDLPSMAKGHLQNVLCSSLHERLSLKAKVELVQKVITSVQRSQMPPLFLTLLLSLSAQKGTFLSAPYRELRGKVVEYVSAGGANVRLRGSHHNDLSKLLTDWDLFPSPLEAFNMRQTSEGRLSLRDWCVSCYCVNGGSSCTCFSAADSDDSDKTTKQTTKYYGVGDSLILCLTDDSSAKVKVDVVNLQGRYSWNTFNVVLEERVADVPKAQDLPPTFERCPVPVGDPLKEMLVALRDEHTERRLPPASSDVISADEASRIDEVERMLLNNPFTGDGDGDVKVDDVSKGLKGISLQSEKLASFYYGKKLLLSLSMLGVDARTEKTDSLRLLSGTEEMVKDLYYLDNFPYQRPTMEVSVEFVSGSKRAFMALLDSLGWSMSSKLWKYRGPEVNILFHFLTPLSPSSPEAQRLKEKSGVRIVWSDGGGGGFGHNDGDSGLQSQNEEEDTCHGPPCFVIQPLKMAPLYSVSYYNGCSDNYRGGAGGPLYDGSVVGLSVLGGLLRATCINYFLLKHPETEFIPNRSMMISDIITKYTIEGDLLDIGCFSTTLSA